MVKIGMLIADRYEVLEKIGTGGMSVVYKAKDHKLNRFVAVKILKQEFSDNVNFVSKFRVEAQAAAGLMHPNIVNVYDVGDEKGMYYIVMELVDGITLKKYIEKKARLSTKEAISIAIQVSMGLQAAHNNHIIHRDIKPQNIIISKDGKVKVTDFGIAKAATSNTITSNVMGSVHYTSPEQARGGYSDERSDIYSLGITIFEMLTGRVPFNGETTVAIAIKHIQTPMPSPREFVPDVPASVEQIVLKCCEKSPDRRYQNMEELIADLKQSLIHPDDNFVKVIHPDEEGATRTATSRETAAIRRGGYRNDIDDIDQEMKIDDYPEDNYGPAEPYDDYQEEEIYEPRRRNSRLDKPLRKNSDVRKHYSEDDYEDDYSDNNYDPGKERRITVISILAAVLIGVVIIFFAAAKLGLIGTGHAFGDNQTQEDTVTMPSAIIGQDVESVKQKLTDLGLVTEIEYASSDSFASGSVISSSVKEGASVSKGTSVVLTVSAGKNGIEVPDVSGKSIAEAVSILQQKGFKVSKEQKNDDSMQKGSVIHSDPEAGSNIPAGSTVTIYISSGPNMEGKATVPTVTGISSEEAVARLVEAGLQAGDVKEVESDDPNLAGLVCKQSVEPGEIVDEDTKIDLEVAKANKPVTYNCNTQIEAPTAAEDPAYTSGTPVYVVFITSDGKKLLDTTITSFPYPMSFTDLTSSTGTLQMSYSDTVVDPATGIATGTEDKLVTRQINFTPAQ